MKIKRMIATAITTTLLIGNALPVFAYDENTEDVVSVSDEAVSEDEAAEAPDTEVAEELAEAVGDGDKQWKYIGEWGGDSYTESGMEFKLYVYTDRNPGLTTNDVNEDAKYIVTHNSEFDYRLEVVTNTQDTDISSDDIFVLKDDKLHYGSGADSASYWNSNYAFMYWEYSAYITELYINNAITSVSTDEWESANLTEIYAPGVTTLCEGCFAGNSVLEKVTLGNVETVPANCFGSCPELTTCKAGDKELKDSAKLIGDAAFSCDKKYVKGVMDLRGRNIGMGAFMECELTEVIIDGLDPSAFTGNPIKKITTMSDVLINNFITFADTLIEIDAPNATNITTEFGSLAKMEVFNAPKVSTIINEAFRNCNLKTVSFDELTYIPESAFMDCGNLASVSIKGATDISTMAFSGCTALTTVSMNEVETIGVEAFKDTAITSADIAKATKVEDRAFMNCHNLASLTLGNIEYIGTQAFLGNGLTEISIPAGRAITIQTQAFTDGTLKVVNYDDTEKKFNALVKLGKLDVDNIITVFGDVVMRFKSEAEVSVNSISYVNEELGISMILECPADVFYDGKKHIQSGTPLTEKQSKTKTADLDFAIVGVPKYMTYKLTYKNNTKAMGGAYYYIQLSMDKEAAAGLSKAEKKELKKSAKKLNKDLRKKDCRVYFNIRPREIGGYFYDAEASFRDKAVFKDENGNTITVKYKKTERKLTIKNIKCTYGNKSFTVSKKQIGRKVSRQDDKWLITLTGAKNYIGKLELELD
ncbi:MAG: leucine-rich repeat protein [Lachnospiraceae bacterium]|nr:leucine-rich repeat protein [Lachnospiraceae bacterium]